MELKTFGLTDEIPIFFEELYGNHPAFKEEQSHFLISLRWEDSLKGYKSSEVHCIEYIAKNADPNVTKLAESFYVTRGAISKMAKKLIKKGHDRKLPEAG